MNPNPDKDEHALTLDDSSSVPSIEAVRATRDLYRLTSSAAARLEHEVRNGLRNWRALAESLNIPRREIQRLTTVIDERLDEA